MEQVIAHIDMDCFFCACEVKRNPELAGSPVIVGSTGTRGVVSAANYEARAKGVFSATPISAARKLCPDGVFLPVDMQYYREESMQIMDIFSEISDDMMQVSVDEAYLDLTSASEGYQSLEAMAQSIQQAVRERTGLTCSIGVSQSRTVSKIASDYKKPAGITIVRDAKDFLAPLAIEKFPGIGKVSKRYYHENGVRMIGDLACMDRFSVLDRFGLHGVRFYDIALGRDCSGIVHSGISKSCSRERTFAEDVADVIALEDTMSQMAVVVHDDLGPLQFRTVSIKIRYSDFSTITRDHTLNDISSSLDSIRDTALALFRGNIVEGKTVRLLGIKLSNLSTEACHQKKLTDFILALVT